jgi:hypothetical protein
MKILHFGLCNSQICVLMTGLAAIVIVGAYMGKRKINIYCINTYNSFLSISFISFSEVIQQGSSYYWQRSPAGN